MGGANKKRTLWTGYQSVAQSTTHRLSCVHLTAGHCFVYIFTDGPVNQPVLELSFGLPSSEN